MILNAFIGLAIVAATLGIMSVVSLADEIRKEKEDEKREMDAMCDFSRRRALRDRREIDFSIGEDD